MTTVEDIVAYINQVKPGVPATKLQKLLYYAQAWSLVWDERPLFRQSFEAWVEGPVVKAVYADSRHGEGYREQIPGKPERLSRSQRETVDAVIAFYGKRSGSWLSRLTHREAPWREARKGLRSREKSRRVIPLASMRGFYSAACWGTDKSFSAAYRRGLDLIVELPEDEVDELGVPSEQRSADHLRSLEVGDEV